MKKMRRRTARKMRRIRPKTPTQKSISHATPVSGPESNAWSRREIRSARNARNVAAIVTSASRDSDLHTNLLDEYLFSTIQPKHPTES